MEFRMHDRVCYECADLHTVPLKARFLIFCSRKDAQSRLCQIAVRCDRQKVVFCLILYGWVPLWVSQSSSMIQYGWVPLWVSQSSSVWLFGWVPLWVSQFTVWYCMGEFRCESVSLLLYDTVWVSSAVSQSVFFCMILYGWVLLWVSQSASVWYCMGEFCMILYRWVLLYDTVWVSSTVSQSVFCMILYGWGMAECCCDFKMFFPMLLYCFNDIDQFKFIRTFDFAGTIWSQ